MTNAESVSPAVTVIPVTEELLRRFEEWLSKERKIKDRNTIKNYVKYVRRYAGILMTDRNKRKEVFNEMGWRLRLWVLDAFSNYGKFLDDYYGFDDEFSFYDLIKRKLRGVRRERPIFDASAPKLSDILRLYNALKNERVKLYLLVRVFSGLRHRDLMRINFSNSKVTIANSVAVIDVLKIDVHKRALFCLIPIEVYNEVKRLGIEKITMKKKVFRDEWKEAERYADVNIPPSSLRRFNTTWLMTHGMRKDDVELIQGRSLGKVITYEHYLEKRVYVQEVITPIYRRAVEPLLFAFNLKPYRDVSK